MLRGTQPGAGCSPLATVEAEHLFQRSVEHWRAWLSRCTYQGRWREEVRRSVLVLGLLADEATGAIVAASGCSPPGEANGERGQDQHYTWIRDGADALRALLRIGFMDEATRLVGWLEDRCQELNEDGPQAQPRLDICGALMHAMHRYDQDCTPISYDLWQELRRLLNRVCDDWQREQHGIWQPRGDPHHFVYSKLMCWVALDRGLALTLERSFPAERDRWLRERDRLYEEIMQRGWSRARNSFVQSYDSDRLDATGRIASHRAGGRAAVAQRHGDRPLGHPGHNVRRNPRWWPAAHLQRHQGFAVDIELLRRRRADQRGVVPSQSGQRVGQLLKPTAVGEPAVMDGRIAPEHDFEVSVLGLVLGNRVR